VTIVCLGDDWPIRCSTVKALRLRGKRSSGYWYLLNRRKLGKAMVKGIGASITTGEGQEYHEGSQDPSPRGAGTGTESLAMVSLSEAVVARARPCITGRASPPTSCCR
jgi:hypothetical protein